MAVVVNGGTDQVMNWIAGNRDTLLRRTLLKVGRKEVAEDIVQDTVLAMIQSSHTFQNRGSLDSWSRAILRNKICDHYRKRPLTMQINSEEMADGAASFRSGSWMNRDGRWQDDPRATFEQKQFCKKFQSCVNRLTGMVRKMAQLQYLLEFDSREICEEMKITSAHFWTLGCRARKQLRARLNAIN